MNALFATDPGDSNDANGKHKRKDDSDGRIIFNPYLLLQPGD